ncbi:MAG: hypothetical protein GZ090_01570 [Oxalobacteraceae bacterium]|nr:hypothetical protein [Oxalobacteraceae bacterium]
MTAAMHWVSQTVMQAMQVIDRTGVGIVHLASVKAATDLTTRQIAPVAARMVKQGFLEQVFYSDKTDHPQPRPGQWTLTLSGRQCDTTVLKSGPRGPIGRQRSANRTPNLREQFWNLIRCRQKLSIPEALEVLLTPGDDVKRASNNLQKYIAALKKGGYVQRIGRRSTDTTATSHCRWLLIDDTGRTPPTPSAKHGGIYDHNTRSMRP